MPRSRGKNRDLHGNAPDESRVALLIIDMINAFDFDGAEGMLPRALAAARGIAALKHSHRRIARRPWVRHDGGIDRRPIRLAGHSVFVPNPTNIGTRI